MTYTNQQLYRRNIMSCNTFFAPFYELFMSWRTQKGGPHVCAQARWDFVSFMSCAGKLYELRRAI